MHQGADGNTPVRSGLSRPRRRRECTPRQVEELYARLESRLHSIAPESQPRVAMRIIELSQRSDATIHQYAEAVRTDWNLTGRLLRLANSAFYAQRNPVTSLERALVVLGTERTRAIALGFSLSRLTPSAPERALSRRMWGESVYRAALCAALARAQVPHLAGEAFVVGLMLDAGVPLMLSLVGDEYAQLLAEAGTPGKLFALEHDRLEFTHVDVLATLARRWRLPRLLARPMLWHHTLPSIAPSSDPGVALHRLAYFAGSIQIIGESTAADMPQASAANRVLEIRPDTLADICRDAAREHEAIIGVFEESADRVANIEEVSRRVHVQLVELLDEQVARAFKMETRGGVERVSVSGQTVEVEPGHRGEVAAYVTTDTGQRLVSCTVNPVRDGPESIARLLGLEDAPPTEIGELMRVMRSIAA